MAKTMAFFYLEKLIFFVAVALLIFVFGSLFYDCTFVTDTFELLIIRNLDELTQHRVCALLRTLIASHQWAQVFTENDFGYGNVFWLPLALITGACLHFGSDSLAILAPRLVSLLGFVMSAAALYAICRTRKHTRSHALQGCLILVSSPAALLAAKHFHNYAVIPAFVLWAFYFLLLPSNRRNIFWACILFGLAVGIKITALCAAPLFFLFLNRDGSWLCWRKNIRAFAVVTFCAVLTFSPTILLVPFGNLRFVQSVTNTMFWIRSNSTSPRDLLGCLDDFCRFQYSLPLLLSVAAATLFLFTRKEKRFSDDWIVPIAAIYIGLATLLILYVTDRKGVFCYIFPLTFFMPLLFVEAAERLKIPGLILIILCIHLWIVSGSYVDNMSSNRIFSHSVAYQAELKKVTLLKSRLPQKENLIFISDGLAVFPNDPVRDYLNSLYFHEPILNEQWTNSDYVVLRKESAMMTDPCDTQKTTFNISPMGCKELKKIIAADAAYEIFYEDADLRVFHHIR